MPGAKKLRPTRRAGIAGGLATGVLAAAEPALGDAAARNEAGSPHLPPAPRDGTVDILHGTTIPDPFRPLENAERKDVTAWVDAQDARTRAYLASLPTRAHNQTETLPNGNGPNTRRRCPTATRTEGLIARRPMRSTDGEIRSGQFFGPPVGQSQRGGDDQRPPLAASRPCTPRLIREERAST
jgi:hypothetical protein